MPSHAPSPEDDPLDFSAVTTLAELGEALRQLQRRQARRDGVPPLSVRELEKITGYSRSQISAYFNGTTMPAPEKFDAVARSLGASDKELHELANALDRIDIQRRQLAQASRNHPQAPSPSAAAPQQLPAPDPLFTGRDSYLDQLTRIFLAPDEATARVAVITGAAGVGKTALAIRWAAAAVDRFPDGILYLDQHGFSSEPTVSAGDALAMLLRSLGVPDERLPRSTPDREALYRSTLADRRALIVLDNVPAPDQARPLLPGVGDSRVLITSREDLAGLVVRPGASVVTLRPLDPGDAVALLRTAVGPRTDEDDVSTMTIVERCAGLPLALRVAAARIALRPDAKLAEMAANLSGPGRLSELHLGEASTSVRSVLSWSYDYLDEDPARVLRYLAAIAIPDIDVAAVAALTGDTTDGARRILATLAGARLVSAVGPDRFAMHDLAMEYARQLAADLDDRASLRAAADRFCDYLLVMARAAAESAFPDAIPGLRLAAPVTHAAAGEFATAQDAMRWLAGERANLAAVLAAADLYQPERLIALAEAIAPYLLQASYFDQALATHERALRASRLVQDAIGEVNAHNSLGVVYQQTGNLLEAIDHAGQARALGLAAGYAPGLGEALNLLGVILELQGQYDQAREVLEEILSVNRELGDRLATARNLNNLGMVYERLDGAEQAMHQYAQALEIAEQEADLHLQAVVLSNIGCLHERASRYLEARRAHERALDLLRRTSDRLTEGIALANLGAVADALGQFAEALDHAERAYEISVEVRDTIGITATLISRAEASRGLGRLDEAVSLAGRALETCRDMQIPEWEIQAQVSLGASLRLLGRTREALSQHESAVSAAAELKDRAIEARARTALGESLAAAGHLTRALTEHERAAALATAVGGRLEYAEAQGSLALTLLAMGDLTTAQRHLRMAESELRAIGAHERAERLLARFSGGRVS